MSAVNLKDVTVLGNPTPFVDPFQFEISYECLTPLEDCKAILKYCEFSLIFFCGGSFLFGFKLSPFGAASGNYFLHKLRSIFQSLGFVVEGNYSVVMLFTL